MSILALKSRLGDRVQGVQGRGVQGQGVQTLYNSQDLQNDTRAQAPNPNLSNSDNGAREPSTSNNPAPDVMVPDNSGLHSTAPNTAMPDATRPPDTSNPSESINPPDTSNPSESTQPQEASRPPESTNPPAIIQSNYLALTTNAIDIITENLKNQPLSYQLFDVVKAPTGGTTVFTIPGLGGDEIAKELTGIILDYTTPRAYWETPEPVEGTPPSCYSPDSIVSVDGRVCNTCVYNTFGSKNNGNSSGHNINRGNIGNIGINGSGMGIGSIAGSAGNNAGAGNTSHGNNKDSNAKACKESVQALLLLPDSVIPIIVRIPVTSKVIFQKYMTRLVSRMIPLCGVVTKITLEKATSNGGQPYAKFNFEAVEMLSQEEMAYARAYGQKFGEMLNATYEVPIYDVAGSGDGTVDDGAVPSAVRDGGV